MPGLGSSQLPAMTVGDHVVADVVQRRQADRRPVVQHRRHHGASIEPRRSSLHLAGTGRSNCMTDEQGVRLGWAQDLDDQVDDQLRFRRDSAGDSFEAVHDQRPPTQFHAQNRQFPARSDHCQRHPGSSSSTTTSDPHRSPKPPDSRVDPGVSRFSARARWGRIPQGFRRRFAAGAAITRSGSQLNHDLEALRTSMLVPDRASCANADCPGMRRGRLVRRG
jgi:hypothetical protein